MAAQFGLLGQVEFRLDGRPIEIGHARRRCVLATLLIDANRPVSAEQMVDRVWAEERPSQARDTLYGYLSRLRRVLSEATDVQLVRSAGGYLLRVDPAAIDVHRFDEFVARARTTRDDSQAMTLFGQALELWRGEALAGLDTAWCNDLRHVLEGKRRAVELDHVDAALRAGRHTEVLAELAVRAAARPLDERLAGQLMLATYLDGRRAEALEHYDQLRRRLAHEIGIDPGDELQRLHGRILRGEPAAAPAVGVTAAAAPADEGTAAGTTVVGRTVPMVVPRQLPAPPGLFAGRARELAALDAALGVRDGEPQTLVVSALGGVGGVGKTSLALFWANQHQHRFPDGQLYVDLRGYSPTSEPMTTHETLRVLLDALGVEPGAVPVQTDAQVGLYRSLVADKRLLIVLDNARNTDQVAPLIPGSSTGTVLITSRHQLGGLAASHGARLVTLDALSEQEAYDLLVGHLGANRLAAEPEATAALLDYCAGLPLALAIVAVRAATHPHLRLADLAQDLRDTSARLDALDIGEFTMNLRTIFSWSYRALPAEAARVFGLIGAMPVPDISLPTVANLIDAPIPRTRALLRTLEAAHLLQEQQPGRYRMHDLVRLYASEQAHTDQGDEIEAAARRLVDFYLHSAFLANQVLTPGRSPIQLAPSAAERTPERVRDAAEASAWFEREHPCLMAAQQLSVQHGWDTQIWQLSWSLDTFHMWRGRGREQAAMWRLGLAAAERLGELSVQSLAHRLLGQGVALTEAYGQAYEHLRRAQELAVEAGDLVRQSEAHYALSVTYALSGDSFEGQRAHATEALWLYRLTGDRTGEAYALNGAGHALTQLGDHERARANCEAALAIFRELDNVSGISDALDSLGNVADNSGHHEQAVAYYREALTLFRANGYAKAEADCLITLGKSYRSLGRYDDARDAWRNALELLRVQNRPADALRVEQKLATL